MINVRKFNLGLEAIQVQSDMFFKELVLAIKKVRESKAYSGKALDDIGLPAIIKRHTNLTVAFAVDSSNAMNAYVHIPTLDRNNPMVYDHIKPYLKNADFDKVVANKKLDHVIGTVDLAAGKVGGAFSTIPHSAFLTKGLLESAVITDEECAAIALHEFGHLLSYYELLGHILTTNVILHAATQAFFGSDDPIKRTRVVHETCKRIDIEIDDVESLVKCSDKEVFQTVFIREKILNTRSSLGSPIYDLTGTEAMADQYAIRMGAGRHLATGLDRMMRSQGDSSYQSTALHVVATLAKVVLFFFFIMPTFGLVLLLLFINPAMKTYDPPQARLERMRRELMVIIKDKNTSIVQKNDATADIEAIDGVLKTIADKRGLIEMFYTSILPGGRRQYQQLKFQVELEKLVNNDLFLAAHKLQQSKA